MQSTNRFAAPSADRCGRKLKLAATTSAPNRFVSLPYSLHPHHTAARAPVDLKKAAAPGSRHRLGSGGTLLRTLSEDPVTIVSATEARRRLYALIDEVGQSHQPVQIHGKRGNAVLISEADWRSIEETLHLLAIPGMRESILEGMATEASELSSEPGW